MAFKTKIDYYGLSGTNIQIISTTENNTSQTVTAKGEDGFIVADQVFGERSTPACDYAITGNVSLSSIILGNVKSASGNNYCLTGVNITTGAGQAPTMSANGE